MRPNSTPTGCHWDGSTRTVPTRRPLPVAATSPSRLLRAGHTGRRCGNRIDLYPRADGRPIALHPAELSTANVPASCRWHLSSGIAHPHGDGRRLVPRSARRVLLAAHARLPDQPAGPHVGAPPTCRTNRPPDRHRCLHSRSPREAPAGTGRPVVRMLLGHFLAEGPVETIRCVAQTSHRHRCPRPVLAPDAPPGSWRLLPIGQLLQSNGGFG
ncbi:DUF6083 domain-containing protein [Streptomyces qaidamensis]